MAEIQRDIFPAHILRRIQTPVCRKHAVSDLSVSRQRPNGLILQPKSSQQTTTADKR